MSIRFTQHARHKFELLKRHGFEITQLEILDASHFMAFLLQGAMQGEAEVAI